MEKIETFATAIVAVLATAVSFLAALLKALKGRKTVKASYEEEAATNAINSKIEELVKATEVAYASIDKVLKLNNESAGSLKKRDVLISLHDFCLDRGFAWNEDKMSALIDSKVDFTKTVNTKSEK